MNITTFFIDLAKSTFNIVGIYHHCIVVYRKTLTRNKLLNFIVQCSLCLVGIEAFSGYHCWIIAFEKLVIILGMGGVVNLNNSFHANLLFLG